jgi:hypothetical protein
MIAYFTVIFIVFLSWKFYKSLKKWLYLRTLVAGIPLHPDNHWLLGIFYKVCTCLNKLNFWTDNLILISRIGKVKVGEYDLKEKADNVILRWIRIVDRVWFSLCGSKVEVGQFSYKDRAQCQMMKNLQLHFHYMYYIFNLVQAHSDKFVYIFFKCRRFAIKTEISERILWQMGGGG